jgi:hypothetical protein
MRTLSVPMNELRLLDAISVIMNHTVNQLHNEV